jgi:hypothetical protein
MPIPSEMNKVLAAELMERNMKTNMLNKKTNPNLPIFEKYFQMTNNFCEYLSEVEGINAHALLPSQKRFVYEKFTKLSLKQQNQKLENFEKYLNLCREILATGGLLCDKAKCLKAFLSKYSLSLPDESEVFETLDKSTYVEVYDNQFTQVFRGPDFFRVTGHSLMALEVCEWFDLFERSKDLTADQVEVVTKLFNGTIKVPLFKPIEDHTVKEINSESPRSSQVEIILYAPLFGADNLFHGILHLFKVVETRPLNFHII